MNEVREKKKEKHNMDSARVKSNKKVKTTGLLPPPVKPRKQLRKPQVDEVNNRVLSKRTKVKVSEEVVAEDVSNIVKMTLTWNTSGWIRVYLGTDRSDISCEDPNKMLHVNTDTQTMDIVKDMVLPEGYTLWVSVVLLRVKDLHSDDETFYY